MITPLGQRQIHQTSHLEAVRQALDSSELLQREAGRKRAADDRVAEAQGSVAEIPEATALRTEERQGREQARRGPAEAREAEEDEDPSLDPGANPAEGHLDFLA